MTSWDSRGWILDVSVEKAETRSEANALTGTAKQRVETKDRFSDGE